VIVGEGSRNIATGFSLHIVDYCKLVFKTLTTAVVTPANVGPMHNYAAVFVT
jgi:hypothetical protein